MPLLHPMIKNHISFGIICPNAHMVKIKMNMKKWLALGMVNKQIVSSWHSAIWEASSP